MLKPPKKQSALDLQIKGSMGTFSVSHASSPSVRVQYIQTYVKLSEGGGHDDRLMDNLRPVREVFNVQELDFEQLMQRDIDDARVSTKLIPYLLDKGRGGLVKLFPPIIVVVLPRGKRDQPASYYPKVETTQVVEDDYTYSVIRSGAVGNEVFQFKQMVNEGELLDHDYAELRLNTNRSALAIVDGQHRAMALLALHRNLKNRWPEKTSAWKNFYDRWPAKHINGFDLSDVKLPVFLCAFPDLDGSNENLVTVNQASRAIFLALNRSAKRVTRARNFLLDDNDLVSHFMRAVLTSVKDEDSRSSRSLRIWNVELDSDRDKSKLYSPIAVTGVTHLFHMIETLVFGDRPGKETLRVQRVKHGKRKGVGTLILHLRASEDLTKATLDSLKRDNFDNDTANTLSEKFLKIYGQMIITILSNFRPYRENNILAQELDTRLRDSPNDAAGIARGYFFDGQGTDRVFDSYFEDLKRQVGESNKSHSGPDPHLQSAYSVFKGRDKFLKEQRRQFESDLTTRLLQGLPEDLRTAERLQDGVRRIYEDYRTSAFQRALVLTLFYALFEIDERRNKSNQSILSEIEREKICGDYLEQLSTFFCPSKKRGFRTLVMTFYGSWNEDGNVAESTSTLRRIVIPAGLDPKEWPKFRYILLEIWKPSEEEVRNIVDSCRSALRPAVFSAYAERALQQYAHDSGIPRAGVDDEKQQDIEKQCAMTYAAALKLLGHKVRESSLRLTNGPVAEDPDSEDESE